MTAFALAQPPLPTGALTHAAPRLKAFRILAFATGVLLVIGTPAFILKVSGVPHLGWSSYIWIVHGWLYLGYVVSVALLGARLRWGLVRFGLVMLAGTVPTMSFVAEHFVTKAARAADGAQPAAV